MASADLTSVAANVQVLTSLANLPDWSELLAPAPMGVVIMSQLLICASRMKSDFGFVQHTDKKHFNVIDHPESFRTTLWQIAKKSYEAFAKAHNNMENILLQTGQVPGYVRDCVRYVANVDRANSKELLSRRLVEIKEAADAGARLTKEVCEAFDLLEQLISQVIEASTLSMTQIEKEIVNDFEQVMKMESTEKKKQRDKLQKKLEKSKDIRNWFVAHGMGGGLLKNNRRIKEEEQKQKEIDKMSDEIIQHLKAMRVELDKTLDQNETLRTLREGLNYLGQLLDKWSSIHRFFNTIRNYFIEVTFPRLNDFLTDAEETQRVIPFTRLNDLLLTNANETEGAYSNLMEEQISLESCYGTHHSAAKLYVRVSDKYIMKSINQMHSMLSIPLSEVEGAQIKLTASCEEATKGIKEMYKKEATRDIEKENSNIAGKCQ